MEKKRRMLDASSARAVPPVFRLKGIEDVFPLLNRGEVGQPFAVFLAPCVAIKAIFVLVPLFAPVIAKRPARVYPKSVRIGLVEWNIDVQLFPILEEFPLSVAQARIVTRPLCFPLRHFEPLSFLLSDKTYYIPFSWRCQRTILISTIRASQA